jgi:hypothetical protein
MNYQDILDSVVTQWNTTNKVVPVINGAPGGGKSTLARNAVKAIGIPPERTVEFNGSLREPSDILGIPFKSPDETHSMWLPPEEMWKLRAGQGRCALLMEEYSDSIMAMQNALCRVILDRHAGQMPLSDELYIIGTGNRTEDKSGANRVSTKFHNRVRLFTLDVAIDPWCNWALDVGIDVVLIQFLRFRPNLLMDFDPNRAINPTPRKWEDVSLIPTTLPSNLYFGSVAGDVGEGAAAEYTGFRRIYEGLPNIDSLLLNPAKAEVPKDPAVLFALSGALAHRSSKDNFDRVWEFVQRMPVDFQVMTVCDVSKLKPDVRNTKAFVQFATKNSNVLV